MISIDRTGPRATKGTVIRFLSPLSDSWNEGFCSPAAACVYSETLAFYACHFDEEALGLEFYTDFDDIAVEEVRLLASFALGVGLIDGLRIVYPDPSCIVVPELLQLHSLRGIAEARRHVRRYLAQRSYRTIADPPLPACAGGPPYRSISRLDPSMQRRLFAGIDLRDHLLLRGLATWLKSGMLWMHRSFAEEANYALYVSLEASFALVRERLRQLGNPDPSANDAGRYVRDIFRVDADEGRYFGEFYEDRIRTLHPSSRYGTFVYAPIGRDDFYWLFRDLREVWRFLILDEVVSPESVLMDQP